MINEQYILDCYRCDVEDLDHVYNLKDGETITKNILLEKMENNPEFDIFKEVESFQIVGYDKIFDGTNGLIVEDIRELIKLGLLKDDLNLVNSRN